MPTTETNNDIAAMKKAHIEFREQHGAKILTASHIKEYFKALNHRSDGELPEALADELYRVMWKAITRCDNNKRVTVTPGDI